ncbi:MAG: ABC-type transport auxiliary lipoprotein family protein [Alphaproteobacteria bacterium]
MHSKRTLRPALLAGALLVTGCGGIGGKDPQLYMLNPDAEITSSAEATQHQLAIAMPTAPAYLDTTRLALSRSATTTDYFANAEWTDRTPVLFQDLLVRSFEKSGKLKAVFRDSGMFKADYGLQTEIREFIAQYSTPDGAPKVTVGIELKLIKQPERDIVATYNVNKSVQASGNNLNSIVDAFNEATGAALQQTVDWTLKTVSAKPEKRKKKRRPPRSAAPPPASPGATRTN